MNEVEGGKAHVKAPESRADYDLVESPAFQAIMARLGDIPPSWPDIIKYFKNTPVYFKKTFYNDFQQLVGSFAEIWARKAFETVAGQLGYEVRFDPIPSGARTNNFIFTRSGPTGGLVTVERPESGRRASPIDYDLLVRFEDPKRKKVKKSTKKTIVALVEVKTSGIERARQPDLESYDMPPRLKDTFAPSIIRRLVTPIHEYYVGSGVGVVMGVVMSAEFANYRDAYINDFLAAKGEIGTLPCLLPDFWKQTEDAAKKAGLLPPTYQYTQHIHT